METITDTELKQQGVKALIAALGEVQAERFVTLMLREPFDYTDNAFDGVNYQAAFRAPAGRWALVRLPLSSFVPTFRGRSEPNAPPLDMAKVRQIGLVIADRQAGSFALALRAIRVE